MPRAVSHDDYDEILRAVARHAGGASISDLLADDKILHSRRTLRRRLTDLVAEKRLIVEGRARAIRYRIPSDAPATIEHGADVPLSPEGEAIRRIVRAPESRRRPVGYHADFLLSYRPNETFYLTEETRHSLHQLGRATHEQLPLGTYARQILDRLLIDLSWNSSRLEGNTYSLLETHRLVEFGEEATGRDLQEAQMILNHKRAIEYLVDDAAEIRFDRHTIRSLHALLSDNLLGDPQASGRLRTSLVGIGGTVFEPLGVPQKIEDGFDEMLRRADAIDDPFEQAFFILVQLPYLQPFIDVNKRVSRLAANIPLIRHNLSPLTFIGVPQKTYVEGLLGVYELNRIELLRDLFIWAYDRSSARYSALRQSLGEPDPFRLRYRALSIELIGTIIQDALDTRVASRIIRSFADQHIPDVDRRRFIEEVETELTSIHEGNFVRYRVRPSEFNRWQAIWRSGERTASEP